MTENPAALEQERINQLYYPTHLLGFDFDGRPLCLARGHVTTTMDSSAVTCDACKEAVKKLLPPEAQADQNRIKLTVHVDLDPAPGAFHTRESAYLIMSNLIKNLVPHYNPSVVLED